MEEPASAGQAGGSDRSVGSDGSVRSSEAAGRPAGLRPSGGYRKLRSFQVATVIYDATVSFCERFVDRRSRTTEQMVQAARSGRQNIAEGSRASAASSQTELRLVNVARASLDELLLDYEDFLRQRKLRQWAKDDPEARAVREVGKRRPSQGDQADRSDPTDRSDQADQAGSAAYAPWLTHADPAVVANAIICLIHQANYLLDQQITGLERQFIQAGGYSERLAAAKLEERRRQGLADQIDRTDRSDPTDRSDRANRQAKPAPTCPTCGGPMVQRTARQGRNAGTRFWGCGAYPKCRGTRPLE